MMKLCLNWKPTRANSIPFLNILSEQKEAMRFRAVMLRSNSTKTTGTVAIRFLLL